MTKRIIALISALVLLLTFFTACGNTGTGTGSTPQAGDVPQQKNDPQLVIAANPVIVYDDGTTAIAYNDMNAAMAADSQASNLSAITDSVWSWVYADDDGAWVDRAVYGFGRWKSGAGTQAKGAFAYAFNEAASISLGVYNLKNQEIVSYQDEEIPSVGVLLSAVAGEEEALHYTVQQDGVITIPAGTLTAVEQVAGIKTGFLAEDGTARSASVRITVNSAQVYSGTLQNSTAAEDGIAVTQLSYPQIDDLHVKAGDVVVISLKLDAEANSDLDVTAPTVNEADNWQVVKKSTQVTVIKDKENKIESDVAEDDGSVPMIIDFQFTFSILRDISRYFDITKTFVETMMRRTGAEVIYGKEGKEDKYEIIIGEYAERPESSKIYQEVKNARADNADDYIIRLVGTKLYIVGANDEALQKAMDYFLATFVPDDKGKIPAKYNHYNKPEHMMYTVAGENIAGYTIRTERYPSLIVQRAAQEIQQDVREKCGYLLPIKPMNLEGTDAGDKEIRLGPMNGAVNVDRIYDTRFTSADWQSHYTRFETDGMLDADYGYYRIGFSGKNVLVEGASSYAINVGAMVLLTELKEKRSLAASYTKDGTYVSYYDYQTRTGYDKVDFSMSGGFGLTYSEDFDYEGTDEEKDTAFRKKWRVNDDKTADMNSPMYQYRPGVYGNNWWLSADTEGNNYLFEVTKKRVSAQGDANDHGYDSVRMSAHYNWGFRFGIWETRLVMATRNGACSAVWSNTESPYASYNQPWHEIDVYENYGQDCFVPCLHAFDSQNQYISKLADDNIFLRPSSWHEPNEGEHFYDTFHHVSVDWTYDYLNIYFDGQFIVGMKLTEDNPYSKATRNGQAIKLANGVGELTYCNTRPYGQPRNTAYSPTYWLGEENLDKFFEVQVVDYTRVFQTDNDTIPYVQAENEMKFLSTFGK